MTTLSSPLGTLTFGKGHPTMLVNDQLHVINRPASIIEPLCRGDVSHFVNLAKWGKEIGTDMTAILLTHPEIDEVEILPKLAKTILNETGLPVGLDTRNAEAIDAALTEIYPNKSIIWTVTSEDHVLGSLLPIVKKHNAIIAGMPMGSISTGVPMTTAERLDEAHTIINACLEYEIPIEDIVIDAICMPMALLQPEAYKVTLETIAGLSQEGITTQVGTGNASSNMPDREHIDLAYLLGALPWGLDVAFINPGIPGLISTVRAMDGLTNRDPDCRRFLKHWRKNKKQ